MLKMAELGNKGSKSNWIIMEGHNFPKRVQLHYKIDQGLVELGFNGRRLEQLIPFKHQLPADVILRQADRTATISIAVPSLNMAAGFSEQVATMEVVLRAAE